MTVPEYRDYRLSDGVLSARVWSNPGAPVLVFAHANGFCARAYDQMLTPLADRFEIVAPDLRGHGRSRLPADPDTHRSWDVYAADLRQLYDQLPQAPAILSGHSMGAASSLLAAARLPTRPVLALVEPVILPLSVNLVGRWPTHNLFKGRFGIANQARRRANGWADRAAVTRRYGRHKTFSSWAPGVLEDYLADGLVEDETGVHLACDPHWEAANYEAQGHDCLRAARMVGDRTHVLKAPRGSTVVNQAGLRRRGVSIERIDAVSHLAPMEAPDRVGAWIAGIARRALR
ncbi:alpha/beta fold hydrolase [Maricaulis salignorans]|uniref:alpha/beta fold hydrolase n=1 Tax=Maricaulis salignorans TaxID=144026 RepID=UPI003A93CA3A